METRKHLSQIDPRWRRLKIFDYGITSCLESLTRQLHRLSRENISPYMALKSLEAFDRAVRRFIDNPGPVHPLSLGAINGYGCHLCCIANLLREFGIKVNNAIATPDRVLEILQDSMLLTLSHYCESPGEDFLSVITRGKVQLVEYRDYGRGGALPSKSYLLKNCISESQKAIVNVGGHEHLSTAQCTHFVLITSKRNGNWFIQDPDTDVQTKLLPSYPRVFQVWIYQSDYATRQKGGAGC